jgi:LacI family transcriptional regulator
VESHSKSSIRAANIKDVAKLAGCSLATVSRVLNDAPYVEAGLRERVIAAAKKLQYVPNGPARALRSTTSRLVGAVIPTLSHAIYATMIDGLQSRLAENKVSLIISTSFYDLEIEKVQVRLLVEKGVESIVLVGSTHLPETLQTLERHNVNYVFTYTTAASRKGAAVGFDNVKAGITAAQYLYDLGHRRFGMIAGVTHDNDRAKGRLDGFLQGLKSNGIDTTAVQIIEALYRIDSGSAALQEILSRDKTITAVFCGSDILAAGALKYCHHVGLEVPRALSVLGFDNLEVAELTSPELSTLEVPAKDMGRLAAEYILSAPAKRTHTRQMELPIRLVMRRSTGPIER